MTGSIFTHVRNGCRNRCAEFGGIPRHRNQMDTHLQCAGLNILSVSSEKVLDVQPKREPDATQIHGLHVPEGHQCPVSLLLSRYIPIIIFML